MYQPQKEKMNNLGLTLDNWMAVLDQTPVDDLENVAATDDHMKGVVMNYVQHQLKLQGRGWFQTLEKISQKEATQLTRQEYKLMFQSKRGKKIPKDLTSAITKLKQIREIQSKEEKTVHRKFCNDINLAWSVQPFGAYYGFRSLAKTKFVPRKILCVNGRFKLMMTIGDIKIGTYKINFLMKASQRTRFGGFPSQSGVRAEIRDAQRVVIQNSIIQVNMAELKTPETSDKVTRVEKSWVQLSVPFEANVEGELSVHLDCLRLFIRRRDLCIDSVELVRN